uniref:Lysozyme n=1 Tax=Plectus sambesii TaxID=2011161 RepID=A0A914VAX3_9BILA
MRLLWFSLVFLGCIARGDAVVGFDSIEPMTVHAFQCLAQRGYSFYITRVYGIHVHTCPINGQCVDYNGINNIKAGRAAGWRDVDGYFWPCTWANCTDVKTQMKTTVEALNKAGAVIGTMWLDIEMDPEWSSDLNVNRQVVRDLVQQAQAMNVTVGIYTNNNSWGTIVGIDWAEFSSLPLWWPRYNDEQNFDTFIPFGGWTLPVMHQYLGDARGSCGVDDLDLDWYP